MSSKSTKTSDKENIIDFISVRKEKIAKKRRKTERLFLKNILNINCVTSEYKARSVEIVDISEDGCSFRIPLDVKCPWPTKRDGLTLRFYFSKSTFLPISLSIKHSTPLIQNGVKYIKNGCSIDKSMSSYNTFKQFVNFLKLYSENAHIGHGKATAFYI